MPHRALVVGALLILGSGCERKTEPEPEGSAPPPGELARVSAPGAPVVFGDGTKLVDAHPYDPFEHEHAGSASCQPCHFEIHAEWAASSHATDVRLAGWADEEQLDSFIECSGMPFTHVLGDRHHVRYLVEDDAIAWGEGRWLTLPCGWDVHEAEVTLHHPETWRELPWEDRCAGCHVTGFRGEDHGFLELNVGCEECHGPSAEHVKTARPESVHSFKDRTAAEEVLVCASCHLQEGRSRSTGLPFHPTYRPGGPLFDDYVFDWGLLEQADPTKVLDLHQKLLVQRVVVQDEDGLRCTSCHQLHGLKNEKHRELPRQEYCHLCHEPVDFKVKEYSQSCNACEF